MIQVRNGVFETNSSSTHSIAICTKSEFDGWRNGDLYLNDGWWSRSNSQYKNKRFLTKEEAFELVKSSGHYTPMNEDMDVDEYLREFEIYDYENWGGDHETDINRYTTPGGEEIVAVCYYGYDY